MTESVTDRYRPLPLVEAMPGGAQIAELVDGEVVPRQRATGQARPLVWRVFQALHLACHGQPGGGVRGPGGWRLLAEPELHLGPQILVPDMAGWMWHRLPDAPDLPYVATVPDWACEITEDATSAVGHGRKRPIYARSGVKTLWFIDLVQGHVEVLHNRDGAWAVATTVRLDTGCRLPPFEHVELDLGLPSEADTKRMRVLADGTVPSAT